MITVTIEDNTHGAFRTVHRRPGDDGAEEVVAAQDLAWNRLHLSRSL